MPSQRGRYNDIALTTFSPPGRNGTIDDAMAHGSDELDSGWDRGDAEESQALLGGNERVAPQHQVSKRRFLADPPEPQVWARNGVVKFQLADDSAARKR